MIYGFFLHSTICFNPYIDLRSICQACTQKSPNGSLCADFLNFTTLIFTFDLVFLIMFCANVAACTRRTLRFRWCAMWTAWAARLTCGLCARCIPVSSSIRPRGTVSMELHLYLRLIYCKASAISITCNSSPEVLIWIVLYIVCVRAVCSKTIHIGTARAATTRTRASAPGTSPTHISCCWSRVALRSIAVLFVHYHPLYSSLLLLVVDCWLAVHCLCAVVRIRPSCTTDTPGGRTTGSWRTARLCKCIPSHFLCHPPPPLFLWCAYSKRTEVPDVYDANVCCS